jgi:glycogen synthase kinase 3 beta
METHHSLPVASASSSASSTAQSIQYIRVIGNGSFGVVYQGMYKSEEVAIKKVYQDKRYKNRELQIMQELNHTNIVSLRHHFFTNGEKPDDLYLNLVMEFLSDTLYRVIKNYVKLKQPVPSVLVKCYLFQLARGLAYLHSTGVCHRDIKPQNLLIDVNSHVLKICDFGSAKKLIPNEPNVAYICSRYYRAPELILGATDYTSVVDVWSMGCVAGEIILGRPLFPGESGVDQLVEIIKVLGTPSKEQLVAMVPTLTEFNFPQVRSTSLAKVFKNVAKDEAIEFVSELLRYEPKLRIGLLDSLSHPYFDELRDPKLSLPPVGKGLPAGFFSFTPEEQALLGPQRLAKTVPGNNK